MLTKGSDRIWQRRGDKFWQMFWQKALTRLMALMMALMMAMLTAQAPGREPVLFPFNSDELSTIKWKKH